MKKSLLLGCISLALTGCTFTGANMLVSTTSHLGPTPTTVLGLKAICEGDKP